MNNGRIYSRWGQQNSRSSFSQHTPSPYTHLETAVYSCFLLVGADSSTRFYAVCLLYVTRPEYTVLFTFSDGSIFLFLLFYRLFPERFSTKLSHRKCLDCFVRLTHCDVVCIAYSQHTSCCERKKGVTI